MPRYARRIARRVSRRSSRTATRRSTRRVVRRRARRATGNPVPNNPGPQRPAPVVGRGDRGQPSYVGKQPGRFNMIGESTGLKLNDVGTVYVPGYKPLGMKTLGTYMYQNQNQWVMFSAQGFQNVDYTEVMLTRDQLRGSTADSRTNRLAWADDPYHLNPWSTRPTNPIYSVPADPDLVSPNDVLYIKSIKVQHEILNMTILPQKVKIYFLTPNFDTSVNPIDCWNTIIADKNGGQTVAVPAQDLATANATPGQASGTNPGANPFNHIEFKNQWRVIASGQVVIQAGEQCNFKMNIGIEKIVARNTVTNVRTVQYLKGLTVFPMFITSAGLAGIAANINTEATEVGYGEVKIGVVSNQKYLFGALPVSRKSFNRIYPGLIEDAGQGAAAEATRIINDEDTIVAANQRV